MLVDYIVCFAIAALAGIGVGGGGLLVVYLTVFGGSGQLVSQGVNLIFSVALMSAALLVHMTRREIKLGAVACAVLPGIAGAVLGCVLAGMIDPDYLRRGFGALLLVCGIISLRGCFGSGKNARRDTE